MQNQVDSLLSIFYVSTITGIITVSMFYFANKLSKKTKSISKKQEKFLENESSQISHLLKKNEMLTYLYEDAQTLYECLLRGEIISSNGPCLGWRDSDHKYNWLNYSNLTRRAHNFGYGLVYKGLWKGSYIGVYSQNIVEYIVAEQGCYSQSMVVVPLYGTLEVHACRLIMNEAELSVVICDTEVKVLALLNDVFYTPTLKTIIVVNSVSAETLCRAMNQNVEISKFQDVEELGMQFQCSLLPPLPRDLAVICYTSGTMGNPKGVMLTHGNIVANISAVGLRLDYATLTKDDIYLSYLPMAHMFERCCQMKHLMVGAKIGFFNGDIQKISEDFIELRPTTFPCVPRVLNKMYKKIMAKVNQNCFKKLLFKLTLAKRLKNQEQKKEEGWIDRKVFQPIRDSFGGRVRLIVVGSAPTSGTVLKFMRCVFNCAVVEGYGQTECAGPCTMTMPGDNQVEHVGVPVACCQVKLVDVPNMNYFSLNGEGEVCVKGPSVFRGYLKNPENTKVAIDETGWLHTGDIGCWLPNGTLKIIDRKNNIFKLAQGEYVSLEKVENIYNQCPSVLQVLVYGERLKSFLVGIVVPNEEFLIKWHQKGKLDFNINNICKNSLLKAYVLNELTVAGKKAGLNSFEQVKDVYVSHEQFTVENNLLTPTMKVKRKACYQRYIDEINQMYNNLQ